MKEIAILKNLEVYREELQAFVQDHYAQMREQWTAWLHTNPITQEIIELIGEGDRILLNNIEQYKIEQDGKGGIHFHQLTEDAAAWGWVKGEMHLEINGQARLPSRRASGSQPAQNTAANLKLESVRHRIKPYPEYGAVVMHLDYQIIKTKEDEIESDLTPQPALTDRSAMPATFQQQTFMEARNMAIAIADGASMRRWEEIAGEIALRHVIPGEPIQTKLTAGLALNWWDLPATYESLRGELQKFELATALLLNVAIGCVLQKPHMRAPLDELIRLIGWDPRSRAEREEMRRTVWRWLLLFDSMTVHGKRPGKYKDPSTKKELDLTSSDALIRITGKRFEDQQMKLDGSEVPLEVSWVAGPWLDQWRGNDRVLQYFGDVRKIAAVPAGKPSGAWAQSIGMALNQLWREQASRAEVDQVGEENKLTVRFRPFTRLQLLDLFRCEPRVEDVLNGPNPQRAREYWKEAIRILRNEAGIIGHYAELDTMLDARKGWQDFWLKQQRLDIRPKQDGIQAAAEISRTAARVKRKARQAKRSKKTQEE